MATPSIPDYCKSCSWIFDKMGACRPPDVSIFFSLISFLPYIIVFIFIGLSIFLRGSRQIKMTILLISSYLIADRIIKNMIGMSRPEGSCKTTFGFPSSHMVALCTYIFEMIPYCKKSQKYFFLFLIVSQAMARVHLKYHTWIQVIGGMIFSIIYVWAFNKFYPSFENHEGVKKFFRYIGVPQNQPKKKLTGKQA